MHRRFTVVLNKGKQATITRMNGTSKICTNGALPPLSDLTLAEFASDTAGTIWNELLILARQPGVCNLGQGFPDYAGSSVAREAATQAMMEPDKVRVLLFIHTWLAMLLLLLLLLL